MPRLFLKPLNGPKNPMYILEMTPQLNTQVDFNCNLELAPQCKPWMDPLCNTWFAHMCNTWSTLCSTLLWILFARLKLCLKSLKMVTGTLGWTLSATLRRLLVEPNNGLLVLSFHGSLAQPLYSHLMQPLYDPLVQPLNSPYCNPKCKAIPKRSYSFFIMTISWFIALFI